MPGNTKLCPAARAIDTLRRIRAVHAVGTQKLRGGTYLLVTCDTAIGRQTREIAITNGCVAVPAVVHALRVTAGPAAADQFAVSP